MKIELQYLISTSLRASSSSFEQGENLRITVTLDEADWSPETEKRIQALVGGSDHRHLTDDFGVSEYQDFLVGLKDQLRQQGLSEVALELKGSRTFCRIR